MATKKVLSFASWYKWADLTFSWTHVDVSLGGPAIKVRPWGSKHEDRDRQVKDGGAARWKNLDPEGTVAPLCQPDDPPSPRFLRRTTNCHLCKLLLCGSFFVSFLSLFLSLPFLPLLLPLCVFPAKHTCKWYISLSSHSVIMGALLCLSVRVKEIAWELNQDPKEGTAEQLMEFPQTKPDPPGNTDPKAYRSCSYTSWQMSLLFKIIWVGLSFPGRKNILIKPDSSVQYISS